MDQSELVFENDPMLLNMGPAHPATHGTVRIALELSGESIVRCDVEIGYLHRGFEIIQQSLRRLADTGPVSIADPLVVLPPKQEVYTTIEGTIWHFKAIMEGIKLPAGETYSYTEGGNGELGFYLISDGGGTPYRVRMRPPCFFTTAGVERLITGQMLSDVVPCFGSVNRVGGECDR